MEVLLNEDLLRVKLAPYKKICPFLLDLFVWRRDFDPIIIISIITGFFSLVYYYEPSFLTFFSVFFLILTLIDLIGPLIVGTSPRGGENDEEQKKFEIFANRICYYSVTMWNWSIEVQEWRNKYPNWYSALVITFLLFTAWIGNSFSNLFLAWLITIGLGLLPGLLHRRLVQKYGSMVIVSVAGLLKKKE